MINTKRYNTLIFDGIKKRDLFFPGNERPAVPANIGDIISQDFLDENGKLLSLEFEITRYEEFPLIGEQIVYGKVLYGDTGVAQLEIRLKKDFNRDTVELFPFAEAIL